jgi:ASC-1-like (ASCH) protein
MSHFKIHCQEPWFSLLKTGKKPVEGRKNSPYYQQLMVNDVIEFFVDDQKFKCLITGINRYESVEQYLRCETLERALPGIGTLEQGLAIYRSWSSDGDVRKWGFLGIQIKVMPEQ